MQTDLTAKMTMRLLIPNKMQIIIAYHSSGTAFSNLNPSAAIIIYTIKVDIHSTIKIQLNFKFSSKLRF